MSKLDTVLPFLEQYHLLGMWMMLLACGFGFPLPEDVVLISGGFLAEQEGVSVWPTVLIAYTGVIIGDSIMYFIGRRLGGRLLESRLLRMLLPAQRRSNVERAFQRFGAYAVLFGRFAAGIRAAVFLTAGAMNVPFRLFFLCDTIAAMASVPLFVILGYQFSQHIDEIIAFAGEAKYFIIGGALVIALFYVLYRALRPRPPAVTPKPSDSPSSPAL